MLTSSTNPLRQILTLDSLSSGAMSILLLAGGSLLVGLLGIPAAFLRVSGLILLPFALFVGWLARLAEPPASAIWLVIALNAAWAVDSVLLLLTGWLHPTGLGIAFVVAQAAFVGGLGLVQFALLKRGRIAAG